MERITSRQNPIVSRFREAARGPGASLLLEGASLLKTALDAEVIVEIAAVQTDGPAPGGDVEPLARRLEASGARVVAVNAAVMEALSPVKSPSGIVALAQRPEISPQRIVAPAPALVLVLVEVQDPGNVGAIIRSADAAGATGVIATAGCADAFGWKALRGSMGSALRLPVWTGVAWSEVLPFLRAHGLYVVATQSTASRAFFDQPWQRPTALLLGSEGSGLPAAIVADADATISIPMREGVDSLNVAVTAALITYEARRQRLRATRTQVP